jgi:hypothetical protein
MEAFSSRSGIFHFGSGIKTLNIPCATMGNIRRATGGLSIDTPLFLRYSAANWRICNPTKEKRPDVDEISSS